MKNPRKLALFGLLALLCVAGTISSGPFVIKIIHEYPNRSGMAPTDLLLCESGVSGTYYNIQYQQLANELASNSVTPIGVVLSNNKNQQEIGTTVNNTILTWTLSGAPAVLQTLNQGLGTVPVGTLTKTDPAAYAVNRTYTIVVNSAAGGSATSSSSVTFLNKRYWGPSSQTALDDAQINALSGELASTYLGFNHSISCGPGGEYMYFAFPAAWGVPKVNVNGLLNTAWTITTTNHVNAAGNTTSYYVYRSNNLRFSSSDIVTLVAS